MMKMLFFIFSISIGIQSYGQSDMDYYKKGIDAVRKMQYEVAIELFNKSINLNTVNIESIVERGWAKYHLKDDSGALKVRAGSRILNTCS